MGGAEKLEPICLDCPKRATCKKPCKALEKLISEPLHSNLFEINRGDVIELAKARHNVVRFSGMKKDIDGDQKEAFSADNAFQFNTDALELTKTKVFIETFFNKASVADIADRLGVSEDAVRQYYYKAVETIEMLVDLLDKRNSGLKYLMNRDDSKFSYDERAFLLNQVFGYSTKEVADMLGHYSQPSVKIKVRRMKNKYKAAFAAVDSEES